MGFITVKETKYRPVEPANKVYSYEELLELFPGFDNAVRPLVLKCMDYEKEIELLKEELSRLKEERYRDR